MPRLESDNRVNRTQILLGLAALLIGVALYLLDRPSAQTYFVPKSMSLFEETPKLFGLVGDHLPTFLHVFGFSLISCGILTKSPWTAFGICLFWTALDSLFEIGQHPAVAEIIVTQTPEWFKQVPVLDNTKDYFLFGSFDPMDLFSILLGGVLAYLVFLVSTMKSKNKKGLTVKQPTL